MRAGDPNGLSLPRGCCRPASPCVSVAASPVATTWPRRTPTVEGSAPGERRTAVHRVGDEVGDTLTVVLTHYCASLEPRSRWMKQARKLARKLARKVIAMMRPLIASTATSTATGSPRLLMG